MYTSKRSFYSSGGNFYSEGEVISNFRYFFLAQGDKVNFVKGKVDVKRLNYERNLANRPFTRRTPSSNSHYGYGPEPGYSTPHVTPSHYPTHDDVVDTPSPSIPHFNGWGGGDAGGAGSSGSWGHGSSGSHNH